MYALRLSQYLIRKGFVFCQFSRHSHKLNCWYGVDISPYAKVGGGLRIAHPSNIVVGEHVKIGMNVRILQGVTLGGSVGKVRSKDNAFKIPKVENNEIIGPGAKVLGPIIIGRGALIAANAVITQDVDQLTMVGGIPGRVLRKFTRDTMFPAHYEQMINLEDFFNEEVY